MRNLHCALVSSAACRRVASAIRCAFHRISSSSPGDHRCAADRVSFSACCRDACACMPSARSLSNFRIKSACPSVCRSIPARSIASNAFRLQRRLASSSAINLARAALQLSSTSRTLAEVFRTTMESVDINLRRASPVCSGEAVNAMLRWIALFFALLPRSLSGRWRTTARFAFVGFGRRFVLHRRGDRYRRHTFNTYADRQIGYCYRHRAPALSRRRSRLTRPDAQTLLQPPASR
jgi:hypothetical protein